ncbi:FMN-linked oxidoreductase [Peniophora sp. CONT]|nr:FMN-linked oxidoreductase [Peniophora sp. CONT]
MSTSRLFQPIQLGRLALQHRVVMPSLTRNRVDKDTRVVGDDVVEHYALRATVPGTLLIAEATYISPKGAAFPTWQYTPGVWTPEQVKAWKKANMFPAFIPFHIPDVVDAVHAHGSFIILQFWVLGREADPNLLAAIDPTVPYISASGIPVEGRSQSPRALTREEIQEYVSLHAEAAKLAINEAGFDGIEVNAGAGYLLDEFHKEFSNTRTDEYGGCPENRARFTLEVYDAMSRKVGEDRLGIKLMPWDTTRGKENEDPVPTFSYLVSELRRRHPDLAYLHVVEPRFGPTWTGRPVRGNESNDFLREIWHGKPYIVDSGYTREAAIEEADANEYTLVAFGRHYTSNPDLPIRLQYNIPLTPYVRDTFFAQLDWDGYNTFGFAEESKKILAARGVSIDILDSK